MVVKAYVKIESVKGSIRDCCFLRRNCACEKCEDKNTYKCDYFVISKILDRIGVDFYDRGGNGYIWIE